MRDDVRRDDLGLNFGVIAWVDPGLKLQSISFLIWIRRLTVGPTSLHPVAVTVSNECVVVIVWLQWCHQATPPMA